MQFHPGRILGIVMGLVILATIFLIPFDTSGNTLYRIVGPDINNLGTLQQSSDAAALTYAYIWIIAFIILVIAGVVGLFPLGTGVLGVVGMAMITVSPYLVYPNGPVTLSTGAGFFVIWAASVIALGASFWHGKKKVTPAAAPVSVTVTQTQTVGGAPAPTTAPTTTTATTGTTRTVKCPSCGTENPAAAFKCSNCGKNLPQGTAS
jgi:hypothetical protein